MKEWYVRPAAEVCPTADHTGLTYRSELHFYRRADVE